MKYVTPPKIPDRPLHRTRHQRPGLPDLTLVGSHLYEVTATTTDGQVATIDVAADGELEAREGFMIVQTTISTRGQRVTLAVRRIDEALK